jgi:twitching motility protein PilJ
MAGDAGRGFAVVADEVQRLAERSSAATKQIEALVKTIQTDTNEAVASMEQTTAEVVRGARLAQDAGVALEEIENVSTTLAELIQNISNAARQQASSAGHISNTMNVIQEITSQTSAGTNATARAIGHLAEMAVDLRDSVQGFKLPDEVSGAGDMHGDGNPRTNGCPLLDHQERCSEVIRYSALIPVCELMTAASSHSARARYDTR